MHAPHTVGSLLLLPRTRRAEVGDVIRVHFVNRLSSLAVSMHPHGVAYRKSSEGAPYADGTSGARARSAGACRP